MQVLRKYDEQGRPLSLEEWCVLMNIQNSEVNRTIPLTVWDHIRVCFLFYSFFFCIYYTKSFSKICCYVLSTKSVIKLDGAYDYEVIATLLVILYESEIYFLYLILYCTDP